MARFAFTLGLGCALFLPACGLTLDYAAPDETRDAGSFDAAVIDATTFDDGSTPPFDAQLDDGALHDAALLDDAAVPCDSNVDCSTGQNCVRPCDGGEARCVSAPPCDDLPVCGCDGTIYANACDANAAGVEVAVDPTLCGVCIPGDVAGCAVGEICATCPSESPRCVTTEARVCLPEPVCGCDLRSYTGNCDALAAGVAEFTRGPCPGECATSADCGLGHYCARTECDQPFGTCDSLPTTRDPLVCGCSGRRYVNSARALLSEGLLGECDRCATLPVLCCSDSADCLPTEACVGTDASGIVCADRGVCVDLTMITRDGFCWTDDDCAPGHPCLDAIICPCGADCARADAPGTCAP